MISYGVSAVTWECAITKFADDNCLLSGDFFPWAEDNCFESTPGDAGGGGGGTRPEEDVAINMFGQCSVIQSRCFPLFMDQTISNRA